MRTSSKKSLSCWMQSEKLTWHFHCHFLILCLIFFQCAETLLCWRTTAWPTTSRNKKVRDVEIICGYFFFFWWTLYSDVKRIKRVHAEFFSFPDCLFMYLTVLCIRPICSCRLFFLACPAAFLQQVTSCLLSKNKYERCFLEYRREKWMQCIVLLFSFLWNLSSPTG